MFDDAALLRAVVELYLHRGALMVQPEAPLTPLREVEVRLSGAAVGAEVPMRCQVVVLQGERALLQVLGDLPLRVRFWVEHGVAGPDGGAGDDGASGERPSDETAHAPEAPSARHLRAGDQGRSTSEIDNDLLPPPSELAALFSRRRGGSAPEDASRDDDPPSATGRAPTPTAAPEELPLGAPVDDPPVEPAGGAEGGEDVPLGAPVDAEDIPLGASVENEDIPLGASVENEDIPLGAPVDAEDIPLGAPVDSEDIPLGASVEDEDIPLGAPVDSEDIPLGASVENEDIPLGDPVDSEGIPLGASVETEDIPLGAPVDSEGIPLGASVENEDIPLGAPVDSEDIPLGASVENEDIPLGAPVDTEDIPLGASVENEDIPLGATVDEAGVAARGSGADGEVPLGAPVDVAPVVPAEVAPVRATLQGSEPDHPAAALQPVAAAPVAEAPPRSPGAAAEAPETPPAEPPATPLGESPPPPPFLDGDRLLLGDARTVPAIAADLTSVGAFQVQALAGPDKAPARIEVVFVGLGSLGSADVTWASGLSGFLVAMPKDPGSVLELLARALPPMSSSPPTASTPTASSGAGPGGFATAPDPPAEAPAPSPADDADEGPSVAFPDEGSFANPTDAHGLLGLPMVRGPTAAEVATPSLPLLLRGLMAREGSFAVHLSLPDGSGYSFTVVEGKDVVCALAFPNLTRALAKPSGKFRVEPTTDTSARHKAPVMAVITELLRALLAEVPYPDLEGAVHAKMELAPALNERGKRLLAKLPFTGAQQRLGSRKMDGRTSIRELTSSTAGQKASWELIYLMLIFEGVELAVPTKGVAKSNAPSQGPAEATWGRMQSQNHFEVLGLHWSASPKAVRPARDRLEALYGPRGTLRTSEPGPCDNVWKRVEEAYSVLSDANRRREYRRQAYKLVWSQQAELMVSHAKLAIYRGEVQEALGMLEGIMDYHPVPEAKVLLAKLQEKLAAG